MNVKRSCMMLKKKFIVLLLLMAVGFHAGSQRLLTLEEAIATALQNNYDILLSKNDSAVAALDYSFRDAAFYPRLNANIGMVFNNNNQKQTLANGTVRKGNNLKSNNISSQLALN